MSSIALGVRSLCSGSAIRRAALCLGIVAASFTLIACSDEAPADDLSSTATASSTGTASVTSTASPTATEVTGGSGGDAPHDVDSAACDEFAPAVQAAFPDVSLIQEATAYEAGGGALVGEGCRIMVRGSADELPTFTEIATTLRGVLLAEGWTEDTQYAADGPAGTMSVFVNAADGIAVLAAGVSPNDPTACPPDQIIGECLDSLEPTAITVQGEIVIGIGGAAGS